jgi:positive regulator of sigma E activity
MTEQGVVKKIEGQLVWLSGEQCAGCEREFHCGSCGPGDGHSEHSGEFNHHDLRIFSTRKERLFAVRNSQSLNIKTGDRVEYFIAPGKAIKAGFLVLIVPILLFFLAYYLTGVLWPGAGETARVLAGVGGISLAFGMSFALKGKTREYPEITKVLSVKG